MTERVELTPAFVLHRRPYRDTSLLLELFTATHGRVGAVARGARGPRSRLRGVLQPFQPLRCSWRGRGELHTLTQAEAAGMPLLLTPPHTLYGLYLNELLIRLWPRDDPAPALFARYGHTLAALAGPDPETALRVFERDLLAELGYALELQHDVHGRPLEAERRYHCRPGQPPHPVAAGEDGLPGEALLDLAAGRPSRHRAGLRRLTRTALAPLLGGRPLRSRALFRAYRHRSGANEGERDIIPLNDEGGRE